ncbi:hypothetical protein [Argonema antarcticum]|uniref:hypothetical protein n=1 Tax=Argonema antarcticum TaxID=2942763 RepID=UPI002013B637|nr:hypothetical protein [Argonema antarcticum]MCL1475697.1 hypothetical protein [Argonema antarcticum A004/B2]
MAQLTEALAKIAQMQAEQADAVKQGELEEIRDRTLASLRLGKQAPGYKAAKLALDKFIEELNGSTHQPP